MEQIKVTFKIRSGGSSAPQTLLELGQPTTEGERCSSVVNSNTGSLSLAPGQSGSVIESNRSVLVRLPKTDGHLLPKEGAADQETVAQERKRQKLAARPPSRASYAAQEGRRWRIEHTYNQRDENRVVELVADFYKAAKQSAGDPAHSDGLIEAAKAVNRIRFQEGDEFDELGNCLVESSTNNRQAFWQYQSSQPSFHYTPWQTMQDWRRKDVVGSPPAHIWFTQGILAGKQMRISDLIRVCRSYRGQPFNTLDPEECPQSCKFLGDILQHQRQALVAAYLQMGLAESSAEIQDLAKRLTITHDEYLSLLQICMLSNIRLAGTTSNVMVATPEEWHNVMHGLQLTPEQLEQCRSLRALTKQQAQDALVAKSCCQDLLEEMLSSLPAAEDLSTADKLNIFDTVAALQKAHYREMMLAMETTMALCYKILSPQQNALESAIYYAALQAKGEKLTSFFDITSFYHMCILDDDLNSWMDSYDLGPQAPGE